MQKKENPGVSSLRDLADPAKRFRKAAAALAKNAPWIDAEALAQAMAQAGRAYSQALRDPHEGTEREILKPLSDASFAANVLLTAVLNLGPAARAEVFGGDGSISAVRAFFKSPTGQWLESLAKAKDTHFRQLDGLGKQTRGRPKGSGTSDRARDGLLLACLRALDSFAEGKNLDEDLASALVPEIARAIHRVEIDPDLAMDSQLFRKEWRTVQVIERMAIL